MALATLVLLSACDWGKLVVGAIATPTSAAGASSNVAIGGNYAYVASSAHGIEIIGLGDGKHRRLAPPAPADRVDDLVVTGNLLFALDATPPGYLTAYRIDTAGALEQVGTPVAVPVGPFSGVAAADGRVIVSGGTSQLTLRTYTARGELSRSPVTADFGRGQPDVVMSADGTRALISTHVQGPRFGITLVAVQAQPLSVRPLGYLPLDGAGFTDGGFKPANFPLQAAFAGDAALIAHGGGLSVVAITPGKPPKLLTTLILPVKATAIAFDQSRRLAYVAGVGTSPELLEIDLSTPTAPQLLHRRPLPVFGSPSAIALAPHQLVVAMQTGGVHIESR